MKVPLVQRVYDANPNKPAWAVHVGIAGMMFICVGVLLVACVAVVAGFQRDYVLCSAVTCIISGIVLCAIVSPVERRPGDPPNAP